MVENVKLISATPKSSQQNHMALIEAARVGDALELTRLLSEKSDVFYEDPTDEPLYPEHWKYNYEHLLLQDEQGWTALHAAAAVGNDGMSLDCVRAIMDSVQMLLEDSNPVKTIEDKNKEMLEMRNAKDETALHLAIKSGLASVVTFLLQNGADMTAKNIEGDEALALIYRDLPDAMWEVYNGAVKVSPENHFGQKLEINWGSVIGYRQFSPSNQAHSDDGYTKFHPLYAESENLRHVLLAESWGCPLLRHPLVKLFLELKWRKLQWLCWTSIILQMLWLLLYAVGFIALHVELKAVNESDAHQTARMEMSDSGWRIYHVLWILLLPLTLICAMKELYQFKLLGREAYLNFENITQALFILLFVIQFVLLTVGCAHLVASISVVGVILSTMLLIFQLGKTPQFGLQVASLRKVIYSFLPHIPVFLVWFIGFGLIFWAIFYKAEESWLIGMIAIMAAMGTGELNAQDHLQQGVEDGESITFRECVRVFSLLLFVIIIVTLYFNLLIGYAVSDIKDLIEKAETLELTNKLNTIYTIESFLVSKPGQAIAFLKCKLGLCGSSNDRESEDGPLGSLYVFSPSKLCGEKNAVEKIKLTNIPKKLQNPLKDIAFKTMKTERDETQMMIKKINDLQRVTESELKGQRNNC